MRRALAVALALGLTLPAVADEPSDVPPAPPVMPDPPLPRWQAPPPLERTPHAQFLSLAPEMDDAQRLRQSGLWVSMPGWLMVLGAGILRVWAADIDGRLNGTHPVGTTIDGPILSTAYSPELAAQRDQVNAAATSLFAIGGAMAVSGFVIFCVGQTRISKWHHARPREPLPPLSGY